MSSKTNHTTQVAMWSVNYWVGDATQDNYMDKLDDYSLDIWDGDLRSNYRACNIIHTYGRSAA